MILENQARGYLVLKSFIKNSNSQTILFTKTSKYNTEFKLNIILSPEFYWTRIFKIPTKYIYEAKKYLPSLFENIIPSNTEHNYKIKKIDENSYMCVAYCVETIGKAIEDSGLLRTNIKKIYFSQFEFNYKSAIRINKINSLVAVDNVLIMIPNDCVEESIDINNVLQDINLSKISISISYYTNILTSKNYLLVASSVIIFITSNIITTSNNYINLNSIEKKIASIKINHKLPSTIIQTKAKIKKLSKIDSSQKRIRETISYVFDYQKKVSQKESMSDFYINKKLVRMEMKNVDKQKIEKYLERKFSKIHSSRSRDSLRINFNI
jgi:hypothetical protein